MRSPHARGRIHFRIQGRRLRGLPAVAALVVAAALAAAVLVFSAVIGLVLLVGGAALVALALLRWLIRGALIPPRPEVREVVGDAEPALRSVGPPPPSASRPERRLRPGVEVVEIRDVEVVERRGDG